MSDDKKTKMKKLLKVTFILAVLTINVGCDQISKNIVRKKVDYNERIILIKNHVVLTKIENTGAFLSLGSKLPQPLRNVLLAILPLIALGFMAYYFLTKKELTNLTILGICFIIGGGIGNMYDRIIHGSVTDFLYIDFVLFHTGIFNLADVSLMIGIGIILYETYIHTNFRLNFQKGSFEK